MPASTVSAGWSVSERRGDDTGGRTSGQRRAVARDFAGDIGHLRLAGQDTWRLEGDAHDLSPSGRRLQRRPVQPIQLKLFALAALLLLAGCQGDDSRYDAAAKAQARAIAPTIANYGKLVSVGQPRERRECSEARPFVAGRCLDVVVTRRIPGIDRRGQTIVFNDKTHVFTWLERRRGAWVVTQTAQWNPDLVVTVSSSYPDMPNPPMPPGWMYGGWVQEPLPGP